MVLVKQLASGCDLAVSSESSGLQTVQWVIIKPVSCGQSNKTEEFLCWGKNESVPLPCHHKQVDWWEQSCDLKMEWAMIWQRNIHTILFADSHLPIHPYV